MIGRIIGIAIGLGIILVLIPATTTLLGLDEKMDAFTKQLRQTDAAIVRIERSLDDEEKP